MSLKYTKKAEADGVGKAGKPVPGDANLVYLKLHGYATEESVKVEAGAMASPEKVKP